MRIVTSLFDLGSLERNRERKDYAHYVAHGARLVAALPKGAHEIVCYADEGIIDAFRDQIDPEGKVVFVRFALTDAPAFRDMTRIRRNRERNPFYVMNHAKDTPIYAAFQQTKAYLLGKDAGKANAHSDPLAWLDLGVGSAIPLDHVAERLARDEREMRERRCVRLAAPGHVALVPDFRRIQHNILGGYIVGAAEAVSMFSSLVLSRFEDLAREGFTPHDETVLEDVAAANPELVDLRRIPTHMELFAT